MISERIVPGSRLVIQNKYFPVDLIVLGIYDFDIVLGGAIALSGPVWLMPNWPE